LTIAVAETIAETRARIAAARKAGALIGFVPTMGALHAGHAKLIETARADCGFVAVSIFVNPLQFPPNEDFQRYPRSLPADLEICRSRGADFVFAPSVEEMYPVEQLTFAEVTKFSDNLCGAFRPGHFRGVATVVLKLLNIVQPERAYFGEKDLQQLTVIRRMARDLALPVRIVGVPTVRESDGLAFSSRNAYLNAAERRAAPVIYRALLKAHELCASGERDAAVLKEAALDMICAEPLAKVQYVELVDDEMQLVSRAVEGVFAAAAVWFGTTRLIDNMRCL
jgi:pantoate--beta-alanine ligase